MYVSKIFLYNDIIKEENLHLRNTQVNNNCGKLYFTLTFNIKLKTLNNFSCKINNCFNSIKLRAMNKKHYKKN